MKKVQRMYPDKPLGKPVRRFEGTFSAVAVMKEMFPGFLARLTPEQRERALKRTEEPDWYPDLEYCEKMYGPEYVQMHILPFLKKDVGK